jgi:hypothetical protein
MRMRDPAVIGIGRRRHESEAPRRQALHGGVDVLAAAGDVLNAFALILVQIFLDLAFVVGGFIQRNPDLSARACQRAGIKTLRLRDFCEKVLERREFPFSWSGVTLRPDDVANWGRSCDRHLCCSPLRYPCRHTSSSRTSCPIARQCAMPARRWNVCKRASPFSKNTLQEM